MEIKKSLFSGGELDPALHDNVDIQAWRLGLKKALNVHTGKNGRTVNNPGTYFLQSYNSPILVTPVDDEGYILIFYIDDENVGRVQAVYLDDFMKYYQLSTPKTFFDGGIFTGFTTSNLLSNTIRHRVIKHNDDNKWVYIPRVQFTDSEFLIAGIMRYRFNGLTVSKQAVTLEADVPNIYGVTRTAQTKAGLDLSISLGSFFEGQSAYVLADPTPALRGWYKILGGIAVQQSVDTIADLTAGNYNTSKATWDAFTGATVQYGVTLVTDKGEESQILVINSYRPSGSTNTAEYTYYTKLPFTGTSETSLDYTFNNIYFTNSDYSGKITFARIYRRPVPASGTFGSSTVAGAWGYVGDGLLSSDTPSSNLTFTVNYTELNVQADYANQPPYVSQDLLEFAHGTDVNISPVQYSNMKANGIGKYGARTVYWINDKVLFSRVGSPNNFLRNFPADNVNSFLLQVGLGDTTVLNVTENNGLIIFTDKGVYTGVNQFVSQADPRIKRVGDWVIDSDVEPLVTTFGVLFIDSATNAIRRLGFSEQDQEYIGQDITSLSAHLFYNKKVVSWSFKGGDSPKVVVILDDGSAVTISYDERSKIFGFFPQSNYQNYEKVVKYRTNVRDLLIYTSTDDDGIRTLDVETQRRPKNTADFNIFEVVTFAQSTTINPLISATFVGELKRNNVEEWDSELVLENADFGTELNNYFKCFNFETGESCLMKYTSLNGNNYPVFTVVENSLPESMRGKAVEIFKATKVVTGLDHLEEQFVSVIADNSVVSSPYNQNYPTLQVIDGQITLKDYACFIFVGLPYISDIVTLAIDTDGNNTTLLKPKIVNTVNVKYDQTRGAYVGGELPTDNSVTDMDDAEVWNIDSVINTAPLPQTVRKQYRLMSNWKQNGSIAIRQVDPLPLEVMSVILDVAGG